MGQNPTQTEKCRVRIPLRDAEDGAVLREALEKQSQESAMGEKCREKMSELAQSVEWEREEVVVDVGEWEEEAMYQAWVGEAMERVREVMSPTHQESVCRHAVDVVSEQVSGEPLLSYQV